MRLCIEECISRVSRLDASIYLENKQLPDLVTSASLATLQLLEIKDFVFSFDSEMWNDSALYHHVKAVVDSRTINK